MQAHEIRLSPNLIQLIIIHCCNSNSSEDQTTKFIENLISAFPSIKQYLTQCYLMFINSNDKYTTPMYYLANSLRKIGKAQKYYIRLPEKPPYFKTRRYWESDIISFINQNQSNDQIIESSFIYNIRSNRCGTIWRSERIRIFYKGKFIKEVVHHIKTIHTFV